MCFLEIDVSLHTSECMSDKYYISPVVKLWHYCLPQDFSLMCSEAYDPSHCEIGFLSYVIIAVIK